MNPQSLLLALLSVALAATAQVALKSGMTSATVQSAIATASIPRTIAAVCSSWHVIAGLTCFGLSALVWLSVLARVPLSIAYPFVALGICLTTTAGLLIFDEHLTATQLIGVALVVAGVLTMSVSR